MVCCPVPCPNGSYAIWALLLVLSLQWVGEPPLGEPTLDGSTLEA